MLEGLSSTSSSIGVSFLSLSGRSYFFSFVGGIPGGWANRIAVFLSRTLAEAELTCVERDAAAARWLPLGVLLLV